MQGEGSSNVVKFGQMKILTYFKEKQQRHSSTNLQIPKTFTSRTTGPILEDSEVGCIKIINLMLLKIFTVTWLSSTNFEKESLIKMN